MSSPTFDVLSYGTIGLDQILRVPHRPSPDVSTHALEELITLGGKATNTAAFLAAWGLTVAVGGTAVGDDLMGNRLLDVLAEQYPGISLRYVTRIPGLRSMYCCILVTPDGERSIIGVNVEANPQASPTFDMISDARLLTLDVYGGEERIEAARLAHEAGLSVVVGDVRDPTHPVLPYTTVLIVSAAEIRASCEQSPAEFVVAARRFKRELEVVVTQGADEVHVFSKDNRVARIAVPHVRVVDTTGAGDAFRAGVAYGVLSGWPLVHSAALGAAAGSINVQRVGGANQPPGLDEVKALSNSLQVSFDS